MSARSFKSVGWVAGVGAAALGCYMLSLQVAAERAELASVERRIVAAQQEIRGLQTELGTRGRLQQLEQWNADVLALSAPAAGQFVENEVVLARLEQRPTDELPGGASVRMASAEIAPAAPAAPAAPVEARPQVRTAVAEAPAEPARPVVRRASLTTSTATPAPAPAAARTTTTTRPAARPAPAAAKAPAPAPTRSASLLDERTTRAIGEAARSETKTARAPAAAATRPAGTAPARATPVRRTAETASTRTASKD
ncbi:MAG TPA: hypothetical protein VEZ20_08995 [Allosphingosinicella sp.]|nr:hypothetical protein [Allosphingosinicella sp.]